MSSNDPKPVIERATPWVIGLLLLSFLGWSAFVYMHPGPEPAAPLTREVLAGRAVWQSNNCMTCHQFYGLGGYLGPDLTNVIDRRGEKYVRHILTNGGTAMPDLDLNHDEITLLILYLSHVNRTGTFPPKGDPLEGMNN